MFYNCINLKYINFFSFNTNNVLDMSHMFELCKSINYLDLSSFFIKDETNNKDMFFDCCLFKNIELLYNLKFEQLKKLILSENKTYDIKSLEKLNFKK